MFKQQRIRDPLHNLIAFDANQFDDAMWAVIQTRPFQRLRRIKQLGFSDFVYPGATHSRFAHSLGVFNTARQLMSVIRAHVPDSGYDETASRAAMAASLVHDIGHGAFSHAFEDVGKKLGLKMAKHELVSQHLILDSEVTKALKKLGAGFHEDVAAVIGSKGPRSVYDAVVSSQFDADRLDYMRRDRLMAGSSHGVIDFDWLISNLRVGSVETGVDDKSTGTIETFVIGPKAVYAAEAYILGLFQLYPTIYFHKTTRGAEKIFSALIMRVFQLVLDKKVGDTGLSKNHPLVEFAKDSDSLDKAQALDDTVVWGSLAMMCSATDKLIAEFSSRLLHRNLFKCVDIRHEIRCHTKGTMSAAEIEDYVDHLSVKAIEKIEFWRKDKSSQVLFDDYVRSPYKDIEQSGSPVNQIMVETSSGDIVDLKAISPVVAAIRPYRLTRYYVSPDNAKLKDQIVQIVREVVRHG